MKMSFIRNCLVKCGFEPIEMHEILGGSNHYVFWFKTPDGKKLIAKFPKIRETEQEFQAKQADTLFGGRLSAEREKYLCEAVAAYGLPAPDVCGIFNTELGELIITTCCPGVSHDQFMAQQGHKFNAFVSSIEALGSVLKNLQKTSYPSYGNIMTNGEIEPAGMINFTDRYREINSRILQAANKKGCLSNTELEQVEVFFEKQFSKFNKKLNVSNSGAHLVITDLHGGNFYVHEDGTPSGFFDVESSQAAPLEFELYALRFFVFNRYDQSAYQAAEKAFWSTYTADTNYFSFNQETDELIDFFSACRLMEICQSYWGVKDGIRDTWGERIKHLLFRYMECGVVDYLALGNIWRERDRQPEHLA